MSFLKCFFCASLLLMGPLAFGGSFELHVEPNKNYSPEIRENISQFLSEAESAVPITYKTSISSSVEVQFKRIDEYPDISCENIKSGKAFREFGYVPGETFSRSNLNKYIIVLHSGFIRYLSPSLKSSPMPCVRHGTTYRLAMATLLHELSHIHDAIKTISENNQFLQLTGWVNSHQRDNVGFLRSPNDYESTNPREAFAVNMEYFLLDPEFGCRRPALYAYLSENLQHRPFPDGPCENLKIKLPLSDDLNRMVPIDHIAEIQLLIVDPDSSLRGRWGHVMLDLVVCADDRTVIDLECRHDLTHHVIIGQEISFKSEKPSITKMLFGQYQTSITSSLFMNMIERYTVNNPHSLQSYPLILSEETKMNLLKSIVERFWNYQGRYRLMSDSCADQILSLIQSATPDQRLQSISHSLLSPESLKQDLSSMGYLDPNPVFTRASLRSEVQAKVAYVLSLSDGKPQHTDTQIEHWLLSTLSDRKQLEADLVLKYPEQKKEIARSFYVIEVLLTGIAESRFNAPALKDLPAEISTGKEINVGYGIPSEQERISIRSAQSQYISQLAAVLQLRVNELKISNASTYEEIKKMQAFQNQLIEQLH